MKLEVLRSLFDCLLWHNRIWIFVLRGRWSSGSMCSGAFHQPEWQTGITFGAVLIKYKE